MSPALLLLALKVGGALPGPGCCLHLLSPEDTTRHLLLSASCSTAAHVPQSSAPSPPSPPARGPVSRPGRDDASGTLARRSPTELLSSGRAPGFHPRHPAATLTSAARMTRFKHGRWRAPWATLSQHSTRRGAGAPPGPGAHVLSARLCTASHCLLWSPELAGVVSPELRPSAPSALSAWSVLP